MLVASLEILQIKLLHNSLITFLIYLFRTHAENVKKREILSRNRANVCLLHSIIFYFSDKIYILCNLRTNLYFDYIYN